MNESRLDRAREYLAIAESADAKREAYIRAAEEIAAHQEETGESIRKMAVSLARDTSTVGKLIKWRATGYEAPTPFLMDAKATTRAAKSHAKRLITEAPQDELDDMIEALPSQAKAKLAKALTSTMKTTPSAIETTPISTDLFDWPRRVRRTAAAHLDVISEFPDFIDAYGSRVHETSDGEQFTGSDLAIQTLDEVKGEIDLGYSNATGESAVDDAISQILV